MKEIPKEILNSLHNKFSENFDLSLKSNNDELPISFSLIKGIAEVGQIIRKRELEKHQLRCCNIFDEVFADLSICIYLSANSLEKHAMIVLRRALELGVAVTYLWDMPHLLYSWDILEQNLNFAEMITHLSSDGYNHFVKEQNNYLTIKYLINTKNTNKIYGKLSDIVHGKIKTFETGLESKYTYDEKDWNESIQHVSQVALILLNMYVIRFNIHNDLIGVFPSIEKYLGENNNV